MSCGFDSLPNQLTTRRLKYGMAFNVLLVGSPSTGKTTLINSLFDIDYGDVPDFELKIEDVNLYIKTFKPNNKTTELSYTIIEAKGFGNQSDKTTSYLPIIDYIESRFKDYLNSELEVDRYEYRALTDTRVHCCIYMIPPTGLKVLDIVTMKELSERVCLIPVIAKSDILPNLEKQELKDRICQIILSHNIQVFSPEDLPLAIAASNDVVLENLRRTRVRIYPWGKVYIDRDSEFSRLKEIVLGKDMLSLMEKTNRVHYERYRKEVTSEDMVLREHEEFKKYYLSKKLELTRKIERMEGVLSEREKIKPYK